MLNQVKASRNRSQRLTHLLAMQKIERKRNKKNEKENVDDIISLGSFLLAGILGRGRQVLATAGAVSPQDLLKKPESPSTGRGKKVQTNGGLEADVVQQRIISVDNKIQQERARTSQLEAAPRSRAILPLLHPSFRPAQRARDRQSRKSSCARIFPWSRAAEGQPG